MISRHPSESDIEALANKQVEQRINTAKKLATALKEMAEAREKLTATETQFRQEYQAAIDSSWTPKELSTLGIEPLPSKRAARGTRKTSNKSPRSNTAAT
jgi:hypothetical protein